MTLAPLRHDTEVEPMPLVNLSAEQQADILRHYFREHAKAPAYDKGCVYIIRAKQTRRLKIGYSKNLEARMRTLLNTNADDLELLCVFMGSKSLEEHLHTRYAAHRIHGEWFKDCAAIKRLAKEARTIGPTTPLKGIGWTP